MLSDVIIDTDRTDGFYVSDENGNPLGTTRRVAIRSAEVSQVIWLILGVGVGLLFVAFAVRVVRRVRSEHA